MRFALSIVSVFWAAMAALNTLNAVQAMIEHQPVGVSMLATVIATTFFTAAMCVLIIVSGRKR